MLKRLMITLGWLFFLTACGDMGGAGSAALATQSTAPESATISDENPLYQDAAQPTSARVEDLLSRMTIEEKIGQMTQVEKNSIQPGHITRFAIGSILSGGGGYPPTNSPEAWAEMVDGFQEEALATRLGIPMIYGVDAVHGHNNLYGATIFPQQISLGATGNSDLVRQIGAVTALEMHATGIPWNFAPVVAAPQDIRWGRTYEGYSENTELVAELSAAFIEGLQAFPEGYAPAPGQTIFTLATAKHYLGDGATTYGTSTNSFNNRPYLLDQGDMRFTEEEIRQWFLPPYEAALDAGVLSVMPSFNSWNGVKMHAQGYWINDVLKGELGFQGFTISDWGGMDQISPDYYTAIVTGVNAGVDMNMVPYDYLQFIDTMLRAVEAGYIPQERIDEAVRRILTVKFALGLFEHPFSEPAYLDAVGSDAHRTLARQAVRESLVLLKNDYDTLPIPNYLPTIFVAGQGANDMGLQCGGWTIEWLGKSGAIQPGTTILEGIKAAVSADTTVTFNAKGQFNGVADVGIVVIAEQPYAEGVGDASSLLLTKKDVELIESTRAHSQQLVVILLSGRPLVITPQFEIADAWVAAWLPGTEGAGVADVLFGSYPFTGKLPYTWPRSDEQLPMNMNNSAGQQGCDAPLFPIGYGLGEAGSAPIEILDCP